ncbi:MAG: hypothetical protein K2W96_23550 [Gemmataceae bacterium]|nr:hypothetical protein [Gemmataceae bacterium]
MKSYRKRSLTQKCQIAKDDGNGQPLRDDRNAVVLDHGSLWFFKVSGNENHDRKRLIPVDHAEFFKAKAREIEEALKAEGITDVQVTQEMVYEEYTATFTKTAHTFAPPGQPEEFSLVVPKALCINWRGGSNGTNGTNHAVVAPQHTSLFARLRAAKEQAATANATTPQPVKKPKPN